MNFKTIIYTSSFCILIIIFCGYSCTHAYIPDNESYAKGKSYSQKASQTVIRYLELSSDGRIKEANELIAASENDNDSVLKADSPQVIFSEGIYKRGIKFDRILSETTDELKSEVVISINFKEVSGNLKLKFLLVKKGETWKIVSINIFD